MHGRRRVGKTALLRRRMEDKLAIHVLGMENGADNLDNFNAVPDRFGGLDEGLMACPTLRAAVEAVFRMAQNCPLVLILDEHPCMASSHGGLSAVLQGLAGQYRDGSRLKLALCGSSMSHMEGRVLACIAPLRGRTTARMRLSPLASREASRFWKGMDDEDLLLAHAMTGGAPAHAALVDPAVSTADNLRAMCFGSMAPLCQEPRDLLKAGGAGCAPLQPGPGCDRARSRPGCRK